MKRQMAAVVVLLAVVGNAGGGVQYSVTGLGTPPGCTSSYAAGINGGGQVVGYAHDSGGLPRPYAPCATSTTRAGEAKSKPNVIIILTDDQGFGELGVTGNPLIRTPHIDRLAAQGVSLVNFHVMPVCSPTRACLMTGRYNYRTGVTDTYPGPLADAPRRDDAGGNARRRGLPHGHLRQVAPGRQLPDAGHGQGLPGIAGPQRRRPGDSPATRPTRWTSAAPISTPRSATTASG